MLKKLLRRLFQLKKHFVSDVDCMLDKRRLTQIPSQSQQAEIDKYADIHHRRDHSLSEQSR